MTSVRMKGFQIFKDRHGKHRCYHRKTRTAIDLTKAPIGSAEFFAECACIAQLAKVIAPKSGTLGLLVTKYRASDDFNAEARRDYCLCEFSRASLDCFRLQSIVAQGETEA